MKRIFTTAFLAAAFGAVAVSAQVIWNNSDGDSSFSNGANWSPSGVPTDGSSLTIATGDVLGFDNGGNFTANQITVQSGVLAHFVPAGTETLTLTGGLNNLGNGAVFDLPVLLDGNQSWDIGSGSITFNNPLNILSGTATFNLGTDSTLNFSSSTLDPDWSGSLVLTGVITPTSIVVNSGLTAQNIARISINGQAAVVNGGYLTAIPEPSTYAALLGLGALAFAGWRRRRRGEATPPAGH